MENHWKNAAESMAELVHIEERKLELWRKLQAAYAVRAQAQEILNCIVSKECNVVGSFSAQDLFRGVPYDRYSLKWPWKLQPESLITRIVVSDENGKEIGTAILPEPLDRRTGLVAERKRDKEQLK